MSGDLAAAERRISELFAGVGVAGTLHAVELGSGREVAVRADEPVVLASVFKVAVVLALYRLADAGELDLERRVQVAGRAGAETGIGAMRDSVGMSLRDLAYLAIAVSDSVAADTVFDAVGTEAVTAVLTELGLRHTTVTHRFRDLVAAIVEDTGAADPARVHARLRADPSLLRGLRAWDPARTNAGTARDATALLRAIWEDRAASPPACTEVRRLMALQVWPHRLASGFPGDGFTVAGKTGTLPGIRNEVGIVERGDGSHVAVAVFTRTDVPTASMPQVDRIIGTVARVAVDSLEARARR